MGNISNKPLNYDSDSQHSTTQIPNSIQNPSLQSSDQNPSLQNVPQASEPTIGNVPEATEKQQEGEEEEEEEESECGFCIYMKGGGCKDSFTAWEECIAKAEQNKEDLADKCFEVTGLLRACMQAHSDYYEPILRAEKDAQAVAVKELEKEEQDSLNNGDQNVISTTDDDGGADNATAAADVAVADSVKNEIATDDGGADNATAADVAVADSDKNEIATDDGDEAATAAADSEMNEISTDKADLIDDEVKPVNF